MPANYLTYNPGATMGGYYGMPGMGSSGDNNYIGALGGAGDTYGGGGGPFMFSGNKPTPSGVYGYQFNPAPNGGVGGGAGSPGAAGYGFTQMLQNTGAMPGGSTGGGSGHSNGTVAGGFTQNQDLWNAWKQKLMGAIANPGMSEATVQDMTNRAQEGITGRERDATRALNDRVAALGGSRSGASAEANRQLSEDFGGQAANAKRDIRTAAETDRENQLQHYLGTAGGFLSHLQDLEAENNRYNDSQNQANMRAQMTAGAIAGGNKGSWSSSAAFGGQPANGGGANYSDIYGDAHGQQGWMSGGSGLIGDQYGGGLGNPDYSRVNTPSGFWGGNTEGTFYDSPFAPMGAQPAKAGAINPFGQQDIQTFNKDPFSKRTTARVA